jgi:hypothetical protein
LGTRRPRSVCCALGPEPACRGGETVHDLRDDEGAVLQLDPGLGPLDGTIASVDGHVIVWSATGVVAKLAAPLAQYPADPCWPKPFHDRANTNRQNGP